MPARGHAIPLTIQEIALLYAQDKESPSDDSEDSGEEDIIGSDANVDVLLEVDA